MQHSLELPDWLVELAARDDPPTVIDDDLVERLGRAGVERLVPVARSEVLAVEDAASATAVGVVGPGLPFADSLEDEAAPVVASLVRLRDFLERFDKLRRLRLAEIDMRLAESTARALLDRDGPARMFERVLETGLVVTYARPYLASNKSGVGGQWQPQSGSDREFHRWVIDELRHTYHAHADRTPRRTLTDTAAMLGLDGPPTYAEAWWRLTDSELETLAGLAAKQAERFKAEALKVGAELGERRDE